jgi:hypothetical protein
VRHVAMLRMSVARHPWLRWLLVLGCAATAGVMVARGVADLGAAHDAWGETVSVAVARRDVDRGASIGPDDVELRSWPRALVPPTASDTLPLGQTAWQRLGAGEVVSHLDLTPGPDLADRLTPGTAGVAVPTGLLPLVLGDQVGIVVDGRWMATGTVVELDLRELVGGVAVVAVADELAAPVASAAGDGRAVLVLSHSSGAPDG